MSITDSTILLAGCGKMGSALLSAWRSAFAGLRVTVIDPHPPQWADAYTSLDALPDGFTPNIIVLAVKPQQMDSVLPAYASRFGSAPLYMTIAAGREIAYYLKHLGADARIIRIMPNTPALIGRGMSAGCPSAGASEADRQQAQLLMESTGHFLWLENEEQMHAVTAISGCGPAYLFQFVDALAKAGQQAGLPAEMAQMLALYTASGSALLAEASDKSMEELTRNVASPGGTTEAGLSVLSGDIHSLVEKTVKAAIKRSHELAKQVKS